MKIRNLLILGMVLLGFTYCSSDEVLDGPTAGNETAENLKMEITVQMPTGASTRTSTGSEGSEIGTVEENQANSVLVVLYEKDGAFKAMYDSRDPGNGATTTNPTTSSTGGAFITTAEFNIQGMKVGDEFDVYAFVNPYDGLSEALKATFPSKDNLAATIDAITKRTNGGSITQDNFFMSSDKKVTTEKLTDAHIGGKSPSEALQVAVNVQRAVARMDYVSNTSGDTYGIKYSDDAESDVKVKFTGYKLINTSRSFYNFKHISATGVATDAVLGGAEAADNYVVDTDWADKKADGFFNYMGTATATATPLDFTPLTTNSYVTENTTPKALNGIKGHTTAVVFKGSLVLSSDAKTKYGVTGTEDVYVWNNKFYGVYSKLPETIRNQFTGTPTATELAKAGVTGYSYEEDYGYPVYYVYYNRHNDNGDASVTGPMEFATVRNNIYKLTINNLSKFGHPNDPEGTNTPNPDPNPEKPEDDIESSTLYMQVTATVLDWTVRQNNIEF